MAKYSRSSLTMKESLAEISSQRAEQFLNTFYFQYGHRSIADLAHIPFAIERLSLLAAIALVDEQRWDGQERSTRYQNFRTSGWFTPDLGEQTPAFTAAIQAMFNSLRSHQRRNARSPQVRHSAARSDEGRSLRPNAEGPSLRRRSLPSSARNQHLARPDRQRTHARDAGLSPAHQPVRRDPPDRREAPHSRNRTRLERPARLRPESSARKSVPSTTSAANASATCLLRPVKTAPTLVKYATRQRLPVRAAATNSPSPLPS